MGWAGTEFETIDLGDEWRNKRAIRLVERLTNLPVQTLEQAARMIDW
jgi:hypothetical protein